MIGQKVRVAFAVVAAIVAGFLLVTLTYVIFPIQTANSLVPPPLPVPHFLIEIAAALVWIGYAALTAVAIVGVVVAVDWIRKRTRKMQVQQVQSAPE